MKRALKAIAFNAIIVALLVAGLFYDKEGAMNVFAGIATVAFVLSFAMVSESNMACLKAKGKPSLPIWMNVWIDSLVAGALLWHGHFILGGMWFFASFMSWAAWAKVLEKKEVA